MTVPSTISSLLKEQDLSELTKIALPTIRKWRCHGKGPKFLKIGFSVRYRTEDVESWLSAIEQRGQTQQEDL